ncbi:DsbA family protein [Paenibacillus taiwanensis]|uniref:DsbA family protein n=1 Tax=Paenibacillus taiwanensis TaxID=401638 RepID=UPI0004216D60|nr:thioredoxin domain-containing protein [Paenibacillus taiwanensis]
MGKSTSKSKSSYNSKKSNKLMLILFPVVLVVLLGLIFVLNQQSTEIGKQQREERVVDFKLEGQPILGSPEAKVTVVEFGDYKCPACKFWEDTNYKQLKADFIDTGKIQFSFMNYPFIAPDSRTAALAGEAVYAHNPEAFWAYHEAIYAGQKDEREQWATPEYLVEIAKQAVPDLDSAQLLKQIQDETYKKEVDQDLAFVQQAKPQGTPAFYINGKEFTGQWDSYPALKQAIEDALAAAK